MLGDFQQDQRIAYKIHDWNELKLPFYILVVHEKRCFDTPYMNPLWRVCLRQEHHRIGWMDRLALLTNTFPVLSTELRLRDRECLDIRV